METEVISELLALAPLDTADDAAESCPEPFEAHDKGLLEVSEQDRADAQYNGTRKLWNWDGWTDVN